MWNSEVIFGIFIRSSLLEGQSPTKNTQMNSVPDCLAPRWDGLQLANLGAVLAVLAYAW